MKRIEDYLERGLTADEIAKEFNDFCSNTDDCALCKYYNACKHGASCRFEFLLEEMPHEKTLRELFFEMFPNAPTVHNNPRDCPYCLGWGQCCDESNKYHCTECWNRLCKDVIEGFEE